MNQNKQFLLNTFTNGTIFLLNVVVGLWMTPYLIRNLGVEAYGMIPLANQFINFISLFTLGMTGALSRNLSIAIIRSNYEEANLIFNTTLTASVLFILILSPFILTFIWLLPQVIVIPNGLNRDVQILFGLIFLTFLITFLQTSFTISSWALNRLDLRNLAIGAGKITQVGLLVLFFSTQYPNLKLFGLSLFISCIVVLVSQIKIWKALTPKIKITIRTFSFETLNHLIKIGKWIIVDQIGTMILMSIDLILVNRLLGSYAGGIYGSLIVIPYTIRSGIMVLIGVITPIQMQYFAREEFNQLHKISTLTVRITGLITTLLVGVVIGFSKEILAIWLGEEFVEYSYLLVLLMVPIFFSLPFQGLNQLQVIHEKIKVPAFVTLTAGILNFSLIYLFVFGFHSDIYGVALASGISLSLRAIIFTSIYSAKIQGLNWGNYLIQLLPTLPLLGVIIIISKSIIYLLHVSTLRNLIFSMATAIGLAFLPAAIFIYKKDILLIAKLFNKKTLID